MDEINAVRAIVVEDHARHLVQAADDDPHRPSPPQHSPVAATP
jgi:hypothetical protein